jgi:hypothetical protein
MIIWQEYVNVLAPGQYSLTCTYVPPRQAACIAIHRLLMSMSMIMIMHIYYRNE